MEDRKEKLLYQIRGAILEVYKELGPGLLESVYEEALCFELKSRGLMVDRQVVVPLEYKGQRLGTDLRLDMLVEEEVIIELKSVEQVQKVHFKQLKTYLRLMELSDGLLANFNTSDMLRSIYHVSDQKTEVL